MVRRSRASTVNQTATLTSGMHYSSYDFLGLVAELNIRKIGMVLGKEIKRHGHDHVVDENVKQLLITARKLHQRFCRGDHRHTMHEQGAIIELCQLLVRKHCEQQGQPFKPVKLQPSAMTGRQMIATGVYAEAMTKSAGGWGTMDA